MTDAGAARAKAIRFAGFVLKGASLIAGWLGHSAFCGRLYEWGFSGSGCRVCGDDAAANFLQAGRVGFGESIKSVNNILTTRRTW